MKVLVSPSSFGKIDPEPLNILSNNNFKVIINPYNRKLSEEEVITLGNGCVGIIAGVEPLTAKVMEQLLNLKCISRVGVGTDNIDLENAKRKGIAVLNTPDGPTRAVAEFTLAMSLALLRKIPLADSKMKKKIWQKETGNLLLNKRIGVIGLGRIGKLVAEIFCTLGNSVIGFDINPDIEWAKKSGVLMTGLDNLLKQADIITLHIFGNSDKRPVINYAEFEKCKNGAFFINMARGDVVNEEALYKNLISKKLKGAAVDVFSREPYDGPLCELENVILTPHLGSYAEEGKLKMEIDAVNNFINHYYENKGIYEN